MAILVGIVEDDMIFLDYLSKIFISAPQVKVVGSASNRAQVQLLLGKPELDVVLLDLGLPDVDGLDLIGLFKNKFPDIKVLVLTSYSDPKHVLKCFKLGADGYLLKDEVSEALVNRVLQVANGQAPMSPAVSSLLLRRYFELESAVKPTVNLDSLLAKFDLSEREWKVLKHLGDGLSINEIAVRMLVSNHTVNLYLRGIYRKLDVSSRSKAVAVAFSNGLLPGE
jgi:DNA-binding NarL/FixJ family response regulator